LEELAIIIQRFSTSRWLYGILFMLATGLRRGELLALKWTDIDFKEKRMKIENNRTQYGVNTPKDNDYHYVPLTDHASTYLSGWKNQLQKEQNPAIYLKSDTIFVSKTGDPLRPSSFNNILGKRKFDFKVTPHMFRHTFVYLSKGKISLSELQEALGHDQSTTTLDIYGLMLADTVAVADKIEAAYKELDETIKTLNSKKKNNNVVDFTQRRLAKQ
jgi:integrase